MIFCTQANRGQMHMTLQWLPAIVLLFGCMHGDTTSRVAEIGFPATVTYKLLAAEGAPLGPMDFVLSEDSAVIVYDRPTNGLWRFSTDTASDFHRIGEVAWPGMRSVLAVGGNGDTVGVIDITGKFGRLAFRTDSLPQLTQIPADPGARVLGLYRLARGPWVLVRGRGGFREDDGHPFDSVLVHEVHGDGELVPLFGFEKTGHERPTTLLTDYISTRASGDTLWIAGAAPPRVYRWIYAEQVLTDSLSLVSSPERAIPAKERRQIERSLKAFPGLASSEVPTFFPPVKKTWTYGVGTLAVAGADGSFALDLYCGGRFYGSLVDSPSVLDIALMRDGAWVQRVAEDGSGVTLSFAPSASLTARCPQQ